MDKMELSDVGKGREVSVVLKRGTFENAHVKVTMGIKHPRGMMFLFGSPQKHSDEKSEAIKEFMEFCLTSSSKDVSED